MWNKCTLLVKTLLQHRDRGGAHGQTHMIVSQLWAVVQSVEVLTEGAERVEGLFLAPYLGFWEKTTIGGRGPSPI